MRNCARCLQDLPLESFEGNRSTCRSCRKKDRRNDGIYGREYERRRRRNPSLRSSYILKDSRKSDRRLGRENDLTKEFIEALIQLPCSYCHRSHAKMTLDRKDNARGHLQDNVVPACVDCNYFRRDMPYEHWQAFLSILRRQVGQGLYDDWTAGVKKNASRPYGNFHEL